VNGKLVYADRNMWELEDARKYPDPRCSLENASFTVPLEAGDNEVAGSKRKQLLRMGT
jgi:hypothetical protein